MKYSPGQLFLDKDHKFHCEKEIEFYYLLLSRDREDDGEMYWKCAVFMRCEFGAYMRFLSDEDVSQLHYIGHIKDLCTKELEVHELC